MVRYNIKANENRPDFPCISNNTKTEVRFSIF